MAEEIRPRPLDPDALTSLISSELGALGRQMAALEPLAAVPSAGLGTVFRPSPIPLLLASAQDFESTAAAAGELISQAEDTADDLELDNSDLDVFVDGSEGTPNEKRARIGVLADAVRNLITAARAAKAKVAGAAAAAKQFAAAKPKILQAEASFKEASRLLRLYDADKAKADDGAKIRALRDKVRDARTKVAEDIGHLKEALEAIKTEESD